jgi:hypothetical protein
MFVKDLKNDKEFQASLKSGNEFEKKGFLYAAS